MPQTTVSFEDIIAPAQQTMASVAQLFDGSVKSSLLQTPRVTVALAVLVLLVLVRVVSGAGGKKLPPGVKRLPRLPGMLF